MAGQSWVVGSLTSVGGGGGGGCSSLFVDGGGHTLVLRVWWWLLVEGRSHVTLHDNGITFKLTHDYICSVITNVVVTCLAVFKLNAIANSSSKPILRTLVNSRNSLVPIRTKKLDFRKSARSQSRQKVAKWGN